LGIIVLGDSFLGNFDFWEKQKLGKEYFGSPASGKSLRKNDVWEK